MHNESSIAGRRSAAVVVPCLPLPTSTINPTPPRQNTRHPDCGGQQSKLNTVPASPPDPRPAPEEKDEVQEKQPQPAAASITESESDWKLHLEPAGPELSPLPASSVSHGSLSDLSRPPSSLFSRSTDLASGRSSILSGKTSRSSL